jgi:hypothetical protein
MSVDEFLREPGVEGWRDTREPIRLPDVTLTGDEFLHLCALYGETLPGNPTAHAMTRVPLGFPSPDCSCCCSIVDKSGRFMRKCEEIGVQIP